MNRTNIVVTRVSIAAKFSRHVCNAFSLVEVVVAVGIFAIAVISVLGLLAPINQSIADVGDGDDASRVSHIILAELQRQGFTKVRAFIETPVAAANRLYSSRDGKRIGLSNNASVWDPDSQLSPAEEKPQQFFEIELQRNDDLSPDSGSNLDADSGYIAFNLILRWPGHLPSGELVDRKQQSQIIIPAVVTR